MLPDMAQIEHFTNQLYYGLMKCVVRAASPMETGSYTPLHIPNLLDFTRLDNVRIHNDMCLVADTQGPRKQRYILPGFIPTEATEYPCMPAPEPVIDYARAVAHALVELSKGLNIFHIRNWGFNNVIVKVYDGPSAAYPKHRDPRELFGYPILLANLSGLAMLGITPRVGKKARPGPNIYFASSPNSANIVPPEFEHWTTPPMPMEPGEEPAVRRLAAMSFNNTVVRYDWASPNTAGAEEWRRLCTRPAPAAT